MAMAFLSGLNRGRYGMLLNNLHNAFRTGHNEYPKTLMVAYDLAINYKGDAKGPNMAPNNSVAFGTESEEADIHAIDGMKITSSGKPVICHL